MQVNCLHSVPSWSVEMTFTVDNFCRSLHCLELSGYGINIMTHVTGQQIVTAVSMVQDQQQQQALEPPVHVVPQELPP